MNALVTLEQPCLPIAYVAELELASDFAKASKSKATITAYRSDFRIFESYCRERGFNALPASSESMVAFLAAQATLGKRASTLQRRLAAIAYMHKIANVPSPVGDERIKATLSGIRRSIMPSWRPSALVHMLRLLRRSILRTARCAAVRCRRIIRMPTLLWFGI